MKKAHHNPIHWLLHSGLKEANFWNVSDRKNVLCSLCPRNCLIKPDTFGYCHARYNEDGVLKTAIWGKLLLPAIEPIETEAVFHYWPGAKILSLGNLGCNLKCDFCQNWESSNMKNLKEDFVTHYSPEEIVELAKVLGLKVISFTYNDPVIWFEFVYETAKMAQKEGIKTLFKSAAFISAGAAEKLTEVIDIFSISLKSINPVTFKKMSKGILTPVLEAAKIIYKSRSYLEISNLVITGLTDNIEEVRLLSRWVVNELSDEIPVHFVRFHPAHNYTHVPRTPINFLEEVRGTALKEGLQYVYIGNTYQDGHGDIYCRDCSELLIERFGLYTRFISLKQDGFCKNCGKKQKFELMPKNNGFEIKADHQLLDENAVWKWENLDARNIHLQIQNNSSSSGALLCEHINKSNELIETESLNIPSNMSLRYAVGQCMENEKEVRIKHTECITFKIAELKDRAHFPLDIDS